MGKLPVPFAGELGVSAARLFEYEFGDYTCELKLARRGASSTVVVCPHTVCILWTGGEWLLQ